MSKTNGEKVANVIKPVLENWAITIESLKESAIHLLSETAEIAARIQAVKATVLVPFLCDLWQADRKGTVVARAFLLDQGFRSKEDENSADDPLTLESVELYFKDVKTFLDTGYTREMLNEVSLPNLRAGKPRAKQNLTSKGVPSAKFVKALKETKSQIFRQQITDKKWGDTKPRGAAANKANGKVTPPKATGGENNEKAASMIQINMWIDQQKQEKMLMSARTRINGRLKDIRKAVTA